MAELLLASKKCGECLATKRRIVDGERAADIIKGCVENNKHFVCHKGSIAGKIVHCRGVHDLKPSLAYKVALALKIPVIEVNPDELELERA